MAFYKGGIWFKKIEKIAQSVGRFRDQLKYVSADGSTDVRITYKAYTITKNDILPAAFELSNYFFLPALGNYNKGTLNQVGSGCYYWSSGTCSDNGVTAYMLCTTPDVHVTISYRWGGYPAVPFE